MGLGNLLLAAWAAAALGLMGSVVPGHGESCTVSTHTGGGALVKLVCLGFAALGHVQRDVSLESCSPCAGLAPQSCVGLVREQGERGSTELPWDGSKKCVFFSLATSAGVPVWPALAARPVLRSCCGFAAAPGRV